MIMSTRVASFASSAISKAWIRYASKETAGVRYGDTSITLGWLRERERERTLGGT